jgi:hypothetical protein
MKINTHPFLIETKVQLKDGAIYKKKWLFLRPTLPLEIDTTSHSLWKKSQLNSLYPESIKKTKLNKQ